MIRRALAIVAAAGGLLAVVAGSPYRAAQPAADVKRIAAAVAHEEDHVTALELAQWIRDRREGLRILDLRSDEEYEEYRLPRSERISIESLATASFPQSETLVLISGGGAHAAQGWVLLQARGYRNVYFLRGGVSEWLDEVMNPAKPSDLTRYFGGTPRVGEPSQGDDVTAAVTAMRRRGC